MENPNTGAGKNNLNALKDNRFFRYANYVLIFVMIFICFAAFSGVVSAEDSEGIILTNNIQILIGLTLGALIASIITYKFYNKGLFSFLNLKRITFNEETQLLVSKTSNMKKSFFAESGEFPPSVWNNVVQNLTNFATQKGKENIKLLSGQVVCIGSLKTKKEGKEFFSKFLKYVIESEIPFYKTKGNGILSHVEDCHFRVIDDRNCIFHYHKNAPITEAYNEDSYYLARDLKEEFEKHLMNAEKFILEKAEEENALVIELEKPTEEGVRYVPANPEEIIGFKKYINN